MVTFNTAEISVTLTRSHSHILSADHVASFRNEHIQDRAASISLSVFFNQLDTSRRVSVDNDHKMLPTASLSCATTQCTNFSYELAHNHSLPGPYWNNVSSLEGTKSAGICSTGQNLQEKDDLLGTK